MYSFLSNLRSAPIASATVLAIAFSTSSAVAQINAAPPANPKQLLSWSADEGQRSPAPRPAVRQDNSVLQAKFDQSEKVPLVRQPVELAQAKQTAVAAPDSRRLAPPSSPLTIQEGKLPATRSALPFTLPRIDSLTTAGTGLAIVVGLFLVCAWLMRRSGPKPSTPLPKEAVAVLGRAPLAASHFAHLLQFGNKLVLVSVGPDSVTPLCEVTDPNEVHRLLGLCTRNHKHSTTAEFHQVLEELANEPARGFLGDQASPRMTSAGKS